MAAQNFDLASCHLENFIEFFLATSLEQKIVWIVGSKWNSEWSQK